MMGEASMKLVRLLGKGAYGDVSLEEHPRYGLYAKKTSPIQLRENLEKELRVLKSFRYYYRIVQASSDHVHIVHLGRESQVCYINMEYASKGTLHEIISSFPKRTLPEHMIRVATRMILEGLESLHMKGYVHCDLKPSNVLAFPSTSVEEPWDLKLSDFGSAKEPDTDSFTLSGSTGPYMPPEAFKKGPCRVIDQAFDIWSLGCVVYEMFGGKAEQDDIYSLMEEVYTWKLSQEISQEAKEFLELCHGVHPKLPTPTTNRDKIRPTAAQLLKHRFITGKVPSPTI